MAEPLVSLEEVKDHIRILHDEEDSIIETYIEAASDAVRDVASGWDGADEVPARIKLAVLARVAAQYLSREEIPEGKGELPMLTPLRTLEI